MASRITYNCCLLLLFSLLIIFTVSEGFCKDDLKVTKDKDGTTYTVGSGESREKAIEEEERDKQRAWDMLKNSNIIIDKRK